jgi:hypothetical protein
VRRFSNGDDLRDLRARFGDGRDTDRAAQMNDLVAAEGGLDACVARLAEMVKDPDQAAANRTAECQEKRGRAVVVLTALDPDCQRAANTKAEIQALDKEISELAAKSEQRRRAEAGRLLENARFGSLAALMQLSRAWAAVDSFKNGLQTIRGDDAALIRVCGNTLRETIGRDLAEQVARVRAQAKEMRRNRAGEDDLVNRDEKCLQLQGLLDYL